MPTPSSSKVAPKALVSVEADEAVEVAPKAKVGPIQVVATRAGFFGGMRKVEGDKFTLDSEKQMGDWMKII